MEHQVVSRADWLAARKELAAKGRDEDDLEWTMAWIRHHDRHAEAAE